ncbi:hypothetical protein ACJX0J_007230, partial [Zea mays]
TKINKVRRVAQLRETGNGVYTLQYTFRLITDRNGEEEDDDDIEIIKSGRRLGIEETSTVLL